jgi:hypothetical protein
VYQGRGGEGREAGWNILAFMLSVDFAVLSKNDSSLFY